MLEMRYSSNCLERPITRQWLRQEDWQGVCSLRTDINQTCFLKRTLKFDFESSQKEVKYMFLNSTRSKELWNSLYSTTYFIIKNCSAEFLDWDLQVSNWKILYFPQNTNDSLILLWVRVPIPVITHISICLPRYVSLCVYNSTTSNNNDGNNNYYLFEHLVLNNWPVVTLFLTITTERRLWFYFPFCHKQCKVKAVPGLAPHCTGRKYSTEAVPAQKPAIWKYRFL